MAVVMLKCKRHTGVHDCFQDPAHHRASSIVTAFCRIALRGWRFAGASFLGPLFFLGRDEDNSKNDDSFQDHGVCSPPNKMSIKCGSEKRTNAKTTLVSS